MINYASVNLSKNMFRIIFNFYIAKGGKKLSIRVIFYKGDYLPLNYVINIMQ